MNTLGGIGTSSNQALADWIAAAKGNFVVARLPPRLQTALKASSEFIIFSHDTMAKQLKNHPEITPEEYCYILTHLDACKAYRDGEFKVVVIKEWGRWYKIVLKVTANRAEVYLVSFFRMDNKTLKKTKCLPELLDP